MTSIQEIASGKFGHLIIVVDDVKFAVDIDNKFVRACVDPTYGTYAFGYFESVGSRYRYKGLFHGNCVIEDFNFNGVLEKLNKLGAFV